MQYRILSADDHIDLNWMPKNTWIDRLPAAWKDEAPHVEETNEGNFWICGKNNWGRWGKRKAGPATFGRKTALELYADFPDDATPPTEPALRLADMTRDGIDGSVMYGPVFPLVVDDPELRRLCYEVYNDWLVDFCQHSPERLIGVGLLPTEPAEATREFERIAKLGIRHVNLCVAKMDTPVYDGAWEPFWSVADETGIPIGFHLPGLQRTYAKGEQTKPIAADAIFYVDAPLSLMAPFIGVVFAGVFDRHPNVKLVLAEAGIGWIPWVVDRMDHALDAYSQVPEYWAQHGGIGLNLRPSEYCRRQLYATFQDDLPGLELLSFLGEDKVMWASDYPHSDSTWPKSREVIDRQMSEMSPELRHKLLCANAQALYRL